MHVEKIANDYHFTSTTGDEAFRVVLVLTPAGQELLNTIPAAAVVSFEPRELEPGTIRKAIGEARWGNFVRMKEQGLSSMFVDPQDKGFVPHRF